MMQTQNSELPKLSLIVRDKAMMHLAYMPFLEHGGVFVPTTQTIDLGSQVSVDLQIDELNTELHFTAKVIWITPSGAQQNRPQGIGVEFISEAGKHARKQIETYLGDSLDSPQLTHTL